MFKKILITISAIALVASPAVAHDPHRNENQSRVDPIVVISILEQFIRTAQHNRRLDREHRRTPQYDPRNTEPYCYYDIVYDHRGRPIRAWICR